MPNPIKLECKPSYHNVHHIELERHEDGHITIWIWGDRTSESGFSRDMQVVYLHRDPNSDSRIIDFKVTDKYTPEPSRPSHVPDDYTWNPKTKQ